MTAIRVLIIEDSNVQIKVIREMLARPSASTFQVADAGDMGTGLKLLKENQFDAVLLDLTLPDSEGIESCTRVCDSFAEIPIVVLTNLDDEDLAIATLQYGVEDYLVKSEVNSESLSRSIRYSIQRKRAALTRQPGKKQFEERVEQRTRELRQEQAKAAIRLDELAHVARLNTLGEMAAGLAHELNQPLMAIIGYADRCMHMIQSNDFAADQCAELLEDAAKEANRAGQIINRMRRRVRTRAPNHQVSSLNELVTQTIELLRPTFVVKIELDLEQSLPDVYVDRIQIQQVILNLCQNAAQAMDRDLGNENQLTVRTGLDDVSSSVTIEVEDTGPGLTTEDMERLFDPFFTRKADGIGLGLSISRAIVGFHGGRLSVIQNPDVGLTFRLALPTAEESTR